ncbi:ATP-binding cassette sub-family C member 4 [Microplitis demolitor]|uniref:ATP-binding cassette sub-family C member 4 n=1 Tax=Microplitis demolitor TaxID=69319 RepID=UPI0004CCA4C0|nr:ATP-binding cassette sub-family C member 4 [Microplitis demolitor]
MDSSKKYDNPNPRLTANIFSKLIFWWLTPLFSYGRTHDLQAKDLPNVLPDDRSELLGDVLERNWKKEQDSAREEKRSPRLFTALRNTYLLPYLYFGFWVALCTALRILQPYVMGLLIWYFDPRSNSSISEAYTYATIVISLSCCIGLLEHHMNSKQIEFGMRVRVACSSLVYRKMLKLSTSAASTIAGGQIMNLLSNDVSRFDYLFMFLHYLWILPFQVIATAFLIWQSVKVAILIGIFFMILQTIPLQLYLSKWTYKFRNKIAKRTDERVRLMTEIINGIQVIKMYTWEKPFQQLVSLARKYEIDILTIMSYLRGFNYATFVFTERITLYFTIMAYVLAGNTPSADIVFSIAQHLNRLQLTMAIYCPQAISAIAESLVSVKRLEKFLLLQDNKPLMISSSPADKSVVKIKDGSASWEENSIANTLHNINITINAGQLCALIGPVGAGKSSLLQLILGELPVNHGHVTIGGRVSYACQESWLFSGSVRNNILFGQPYDERRYRQVTKACALLKDFVQLPQGDKTLVGERGAALSGGQQARINLARAVYRDADIYLLDDPLSAVDTQVGKSLFEDCIKGFLGNKTRILVTHQVQYLKDVDLIVVLNNGVIEKQGSYESFDPQHFKLMHSNSTEGSEKSSSVDKEATPSADTSYMSNGLSEDESEEPEETQELMAKGNLNKALVWKYFRAGGSFVMLLTWLLFTILGQIGSSGSDYWVAYWTTQEEIKFRIHDKSFANDTLGTLDGNSTSGTSDNDTSVDLQEAINQTLLANQTMAGDEAFYDKNTALTIYGILIALCVIMITARNLMFYKVCMNASKNLHNSMFACLLQAPMKFFNTTSSGRILNRFSKDIGCVDEQLPKCMVEAIQIYAVMLGIFVQIIIVHWWMVFFIIVMIIFYWVIKNIYLATAQDVKRLEGVVKSPVFTHVSSSMAGLTTIRSGNSQELVRKEFDSYQDVHTSAFSMIVFTSAWFSLWLDVVTITFVACTIYSFVIIDNENTFAGSVGLVVSQILILCGMCQFGIRTTAEAMTQMTSVERVLQFTKLDKEGPFESDVNQKPPSTWPSHGQIKFEHVYLRYNEDDAPVLKDLNVTFDAGIKVGIVGRTGAGKSSLISALFNLTKFDGNIYIDGLSTNKIGLHDLRSKLSIIPQEPILFSATLRDNLDPFHEYDDASIWSALEEVELKSAAPSLDYIVTQGGSNFSAGQRQLLCLARAIVRNNKILIMDEATANVDPATDELIQKTIRNKFRNCTVLTIAHRLNTIMDSDRVLVMDSGRIVEFDHPHLLLQNQEGYFSRMLKETGKAMNDKLKLISQETYNSKFTADEPPHLVNGTPKP